jgi:hypothetical protein
MRTLRKNMVLGLLMVLLTIAVHAQGSAVPSNRNIEIQTAKMDSIKEIIQKERQKITEEKVSKSSSQVIQKDSIEKQGLLALTGKVVSADGFGVSGANLIVQGTKVGTITDFDGNFTLLAPVNSNVTVSYIGLASFTFVAKDYDKLKIDIDSMISYFYCKNHNGDHVAYTIQDTEKLKKEKGCVFFK